MHRLRPFALLALGLTSAFAQDPGQVPPPGVPIPGVEPQPPAGAPAAAPQQPAANLADTKIVEDIIEPKLSGNALAGLYRKYTGRRVIVSAAAAAAEFSFVQEASPQDPLTYGKAAELLRKAATIENFIFVPDAEDPNLDILTIATGGIRPTGRGVDVYNEGDPLPEGDAVISYVMKLSYIKPDEAVRTFTQIIGQFGAYGSIAAVPNAAAVVITENTSLIRKLIDLKAEIDKPSSQVATRFIRVQYADVTELAATLNELLNAQQQAQRSAGSQRVGAGGGGGNGAQPPGGATPDVPGGAASGEETPVQIIPDPRTNRIFAMGRPVDLLFVEGLVSEFDTQSDQRNFLRRKLKFLAVSDFLPIAGDALTRAFSGTGTGAEGGATGGGTSSGRPSNQGGGNRGSAAANNTGAGQFGGASGAGGAAGGGARADALSAPSVSSAPESLLIGRTLLVADNITNSIVVQGPPSGVEIIERLLDQVDVKADQVMISTVFGQLSLNDTLSTGVDWINLFNNNQLGGNNGGIGGSMGGSSTGAFDPGNLTDFTNTSSPATATASAIAGFPARAGLNIYGKIGSDLAAFVNLLQTDSNFTVLSRPSIFTGNNQKGTISSGRRIAIPTNSNSFSGGGVSTNIEYRDVVLKLEVIPLINSKDEVTLQIALISDDVIGESEPIGDLGPVPIIGTREILTTVTVPNNQTVVLGGLITTNDEESIRGVPILSSIPGLGRLFSTKTNTTNKDELLVFIQPSIVSSSYELDAVQTDMDSRYEVSDAARRFADGPGVLPPLDAIEPTKGKGSSSPAPAIAAPVQDAPAVKKSRSSLRPIHRP